MRLVGLRSSGWAGFLRRIRRDPGGMAAVEFALVLPVMVAMFLALSEFQPAFDIKRKLSNVTATLADITPRSATSPPLTDLTRTAVLAPSDLKSVFDIVSVNMRPYDSKTLRKTQVVISSVAVASGATTGTVLWSCAWNEGADLSKRAFGSTVAVPDTLRDQGTRAFIQVETLYPYTPTIGRTITGTIKLKDAVGWPVRNADSVTLFPLICPTQT